MFKGMIQSGFYHVDIMDLQDGKSENKPYESDIT